MQNGDSQFPDPHGHGNGTHHVAVSLSGAMARKFWKMPQIMAEFVADFERQAMVRPSVSIIGSARIASGLPYYALIEDIARRLANAGFDIVSGGGSGLVKTAKPGAYRGKRPGVGLNIRLPHEQRTPFRT